MKYGDLIDAGIITRADLPRAWEGFPSLVLPVEGEIDFYEVMYRRYANREIGGDTPAVFLRFLNEETLNLIEMLPNGLFSKVLADMVADASEETRTIGGQDTNNITRSASGSNTHTGANKSVTAGTTSTNRTTVVDGETTRNAETKDATQTTDGTTTHTGSTTERAAPNGIIEAAYSTGGRTDVSTDTTNSTTTTAAKEIVDTTDDTTTTITGGDSNNNTVNDTIDERGTSTESGTETATRDHNTTENVTRKGAASGDMARAYAILRDGKPLVMWIADRYNACFMGVY